MTGFFRRIYDLGVPRKRSSTLHVLQKWKNTLIEKINPDSGIMETLIEAKILTQEEVSRIKSRMTVQERNKKLLEYIYKRKRFEEFVTALKETDQDAFGLTTELDALRKECEEAKEAPRSHQNTKCIIKDTHTRARNQHKKHKNHRKKQQTAITTVNDLSDRIVDLILMKAVVLMASKTELMERSEQQHQTAEVAVQLRTVQSKWNCGIAVASFRRKLRQHLNRTIIKLQSQIVLPDNWIYGVTKLGNCIYVLCQWSNSIRIYNESSPFNFHSELHLSDIRRPYDMAASDAQVCIYVTDSITKNVWKIDVRNMNTGDQVNGHSNEQRVAKWISNIGSPFTLSLSDRGHIVMVTWGPPASLDIYDPEGTLAVHRSLPADLKFPLHAVQTSTGSYVISHVWKDSWNWTVSEMNMEGRVIRRFSPKQKSQLLHWPRHLTLDLEDRLLVCDCENDRVVLLDLDLGSSDEILTKSINRVSRPERLYYDIHKRQLIVAHFEGKLDIYYLMLKSNASSIICSFL